MQTDYTLSTARCATSASDCALNEMVLTGPQGVLIQERFTWAQFSRGSPERARGC